MLAFKLAIEDVMFELWLQALYSKHMRLIVVLNYEHGNVMTNY